MALIGSSNSLGGIGGSNAVARLLVVISGDSTPLTTALAKAEGEMGGLSKSASSIGNALTRSLSLPLLALGGYAVKAASDFETALARVAGLTPILQQTGQSIDEISDKLIELASDPQVTAGPTDLANSLFLAGSAGLDVSEIFPVVKLSAQGMSAGMGEATDISKVLIAALNNYRGTGLTAARAMDVLTVAIKDGTAAPDELAIALGRLLPIAAAAGVSFEATAASVAALTNLGVPTRVATTSLRALFSELLAPTEAAKKRLDEFGVSATQLRNTLANNGPVAAFELLQRAVHGNVEALHDIIPQIRGFTSYLGLTGTNAKSYTQIIKDAEHATGAFKQALDIVSATPEFQFQKGLQELKIAAINIGQDLLPLFVGLAKVFQQVGSAIGGLGPVLTSAIAGFIALGAVAGPLIKLYGTITTVAETTTRLAQGATIALPTIKALGVGFLTMSVAAIAAVGGFQSLMRGSTSLVSIGTTLVGTFVAVRLALAGLQAAALKFGSGGLLSLVLGGASGGALTGIALAIGGVVTLLGLAAGASKRLDEAVDEMGTSLLEAAKSGTTLGEALKDIQDQEIAARLRRIGQEAGLLGKSVGEAFAPLAGSLGAKISQNLRPLENLGIFQGITGAQGLGDLADKLDNAVDSGRSLAFIQQLLTESGDAYTNTLAQISGAESATTDKQRAQADAAQSQIATFLELINVRRQFDQAQQATIASSLDETAAVQDLADRTGVSVDTIQAALSRYNVSAAGMSSQTEASFLQAAAGVDKNGNKITLKMKEMEDAAAELADELSQSLSSGFDLFGELPKKVGDFDAIIKKAQQLGQVMVDQASNVRILLERGVPTGLIDQFISQGPAMVAAFANATTPQLAKVVDAYDLAMGAMDASILQEAVHQEGKGKRMVEGFATAILSANNLLPGVGAKIVQAVAAGFSAGTLKPKALALIIEFVRTLNSASGVSRAAGSKAAQAFAEGIASGDYVGPKGKILVGQAARGIAAASGLSLGAAKKLVQSIADGMDNNKGKVLASGHHVANEAINAFKDKSAVPEGEKFVRDFASGMGHNLGLVDRAAQTMAARAKAALDAALRGSPYYASLPMGRKWVSDFYAGADDESKKHQSDADKTADNITAHFNQALLNKVPRFADVLSTLKDLVKENMKKAFDAGDMEMVRSLEVMGKHLEDHLNKLHDRFTTFRQGIREGFSELRDFGSFVTDTWSQYQEDLKKFNEDMKQYQEDLKAFVAGGSTGTAPTEPTAPNAPDFQALIANQVAEAQRLARDLMKAAKLGLNQVLLSQFAAQGSAGADALEQLIANPQLIQQLNEASDKIRNVTGNLVDSLGEKYFGKALNFAIKSLNKFAESIVKLIKELLTGLGDKNRKLIGELQHMLEQIRKFADSIPSVPKSPGNGPGGPTPTMGGGTSGGPGGFDTGWGTGGPQWEPSWEPTWKPTWEPTWHPPNKPNKPNDVTNRIDTNAKSAAPVTLSGPITVVANTPAQFMAEIQKVAQKHAKNNGGRTGLVGANG